MVLFPEPLSPRSPRALAGAVIVALLLLAPQISDAIGESYYVTIVTRILVFGLAATSLNLILGYGGLISFGHALYLGIGAYTVGLLSFYGVSNGWIHLAATLVFCAIVALLTGLVCMRTSGIGFIMITLAFAQMFFFLGVSLKQYGGDDGLKIPLRSDFTPLFSIEDNRSLYYFTLMVTLAALYLTWRFINARFGRVLRGTKSNIERMKVLGFPVLRYQVIAYMVSGCACGVAGLLLANFTRFSSPAYMFWTVSGDLIVMVILGGLATVMGPLVGAAVYVVLETVLSAYTQHWMAILGPLILIIALTATRGVWGLLPRAKAQGVESRGP
jgi:branched-chain amino acid transport system permease protein